MKENMAMLYVRLQLFLVPALELGVLDLPLSSIYHFCGFLLLQKWQVTLCLWVIEIESGAMTARVN